MQPRSLTCPAFAGGTYPRAVIRLIARLARLFKQASDTSEWLRRIGGELLGPGRKIPCLFRHRRRLVLSVLGRDFDEL